MLINEESFERGADDARRGRPSLFRSTRAHGIIANGDDPLSDEWTDEMRRDYLEGYNSTSEEPDGE